MYVSKLNTEKLDFEQGTAARRFHCREGSTQRITQDVQTTLIYGRKPLCKFRALCFEPSSNPSQAKHWPIHEALMLQLLSRPTVGEVTVQPTRHYSQSGGNAPRGKRLSSTHFLVPSIKIMFGVCASRRQVSTCGIERIIRFERI